METIRLNGTREPRCSVTSIQPGSIVRFGIDDDMTVLVVANFPSTILVGDINVCQTALPRRRLVYFGCFCDSPDSWERARLFHQDHDPKDTLTVLFPPVYS